MNINLTTHNAISAGILALVALTSPCHAQSTTPNFVSDNGNFSGDHFRIQTDLFGFAIASSSGTTSSTLYCAPKGSKFQVVYDSNTNTSSAPSAGAASTVRFINIPATVNNSDTACTSNVVNTYTAYTLPDTTLQSTPVKRSGIVFGGLLVPFKYNLSSKQLQSSPTTAPFVGFRTGYEPYGLSFVPVAMLGLAFSTSQNNTANSNGTNTSLSTGIGLRLSSSKNENWHGGIMFGRDFGGGNTTATNPSSTSAYSWVSMFLGYSM